MPRTVPVDEVRRRFAASGGGPASVPRGYDLHGETLVVRVPRALAEGPEGRALGAAYAATFGVAHVVADVGGSSGELREPATARLFGEGTAIATAKEGPLRYRYDAMRAMFSSGNKDERERILRSDLRGLAVADLFAGIGYYAVPAALAGARKVWAIEKNPEAFRWLRENVEGNGVADRVECLLGDCRDHAPRGEADLVVMGYLQGTYDFLPHAFAALRPAGGRILFHENCEVEDYPDVPLGRLDEAAEAAGFHVVRAAPRVSKSFAPRVDHVVVDLEVRR